MALKVYSSLDEALKDIQFEQKNNHKQIVLGFDEKKAYVQPQMGKIILWLSKNLDHLGYRQSEKLQHDILALLVELISNSYRNGVENHPDTVCSIEAYVGRKGVLLGSKQYAGFLKDKQIKLLKESKIIPSTNKDTCNAGTEIFIEDGSGLLINKAENGIYISKYFA